MADLKIDLTQLDELRVSLTEIATRFDSADQFSDDVATAVGELGALQGKAHEFAHNWNDTRESLAKNLRTLADAATTIHDTFVEIDSQLASQADALDAGMLSAMPAGPTP